MFGNCIFCVENIIGSYIFLKTEKDTCMILQSKKKHLKMILHPALKSSFARIHVKEISFWS